MKRRPSGIFRIKIEPGKSRKGVRKMNGLQGKASLSQVRKRVDSASCRRGNAVFPVRRKPPMSEGK